MTHETIKDKIYEIICNGNHSTESIYERVKKYGISDGEATAAIAELKNENRIEGYVCNLYSNVARKDSEKRMCFSFALYAGHNCVMKFPYLWFETVDHAHRFAEGMLTGSYAFRKRPAVAAYIQTEDGTSVFSFGKNISGYVNVPWRI